MSQFFACSKHTYYVSESGKVWRLYLHGQGIHGPSVVDVIPPDARPLTPDEHDAAMAARCEVLEATTQSLHVEAVDECEAMRAGAA